MKKCIKCSIVKEKAEFYQNSKAKDGLHSYCRECNTSLKKLWAKKNPNKIKAIKRKQTLGKYGLTQKEYEEKAALQKYCCEICGQPEKKYKQLAVDHNHVTGQIRGLLCSKCNYYLGNIEAYFASVKAGIAYLEKYNLNVV